MNRECFIQNLSSDNHSRQDSKEILSRLVVDQSIILTILVHYLDHPLDPTCHKQGQPSFDTWLFLHFIGTYLHTDSWPNNPNIPRSFSISISGCTLLWGPLWDNFLKADHWNWSNAVQIGSTSSQKWMKAEKERQRPSTEDRENYLKSWMPHLVSEILHRSKNTQIFPLTGYLATSKPSI